MEISEPKHRPGYTVAFIFFIFDILILGWLGGKAVTENTLFLSQVCTGLYMVYFLVFLPLYSQFIRILNISLERYKIY